MTCEHLRPLLDEVRAMQQLFKLGENFCERSSAPCGRQHGEVRKDDSAP